MGNSPTIAAIDARFCESNQFVTLCGRPHTSSSDSAFLDSHSDAVRFEIQPRALTRRHTLVDAHGAAIANFKDSNASSDHPVTHVYRGEGCEGPELFQIQSQHQSDGTTSLRVAFINVMTDKLYEMGFEGNWHHRDGLFWLNRDCSGARKPVAKLCCSDSVDRHRFQVEIAPNANLAVVVMICGLLRDREWRNERSLIGIF